MGVCFYVSGHGLGHAARAVRIMEVLPASVPLWIKSVAPESFFRRELHRPFEYRPEAFDFGAAQQSNFAVDWPKTFREARAMQTSAMRRLAAESRFLEQEGIRAVVCDIAPPPLQAAAMAGIPGVAVANFTWMDVFRRHASAPEEHRLLRDYAAAHATATLTLRTPMSFVMRGLPRVTDIPLIAPRGRPQRARLRRSLGLARSDKVALVYLGIWGHQDLDFDRLSALRGVTLVSFLPLPPPIRTLSPDEWLFADAVASVDAVVAKPGYGTMAACMACGTPVVYYPRAEFAEYAVLRRGLEDWGGAVQMTRRDLMAGRWGAALDEAFLLHPPRVDASGARKAARLILQEAGLHGA
ncbi:MAG: hypothetical protein N2111_09290 [Candidatus Sumerlaeaceae bacterium]|nr:hypothetical protein [Candidatus Sumerlaeaceae bacterium]